MHIEQIIKTWFEQWEKGDFFHLPITKNFMHTSPFGTIKGRKEYMKVVEANQDKFLGYRFDIHDAMYGKNKACVRYTAVQGDFTLDVSEWYYLKDHFIEKIISYYHIGEIREERELSTVDKP